MAKITYDNEVKAMLRASGMTEEQILASEREANQSFKKLMETPAPPTRNTIWRKFQEDDLFPMKG